MRSPMKHLFNSLPLLLLCTIGWAAPTAIFPIGEIQTSSVSVKPKATFVGQLHLNQQQYLPAYATTMSSGYADSGLSTFQPEQLKLPMTLKPQLIKQLAAYYHQDGWILVPRGWTLTQAGVGANGSSLLLFQGPQQQGYLRYQSTGACVGCALAEASVFFPEAVAEAKAGEFLYYANTSTPIHTIRLRPHYIAYQAQTPKQQRVDGLVYYNAADDLPYFRLELSFPASLQPLATPILNFYLPVKNKSR
jgi:hypothetical protein